MRDTLSKVFGTIEEITSDGKLIVVCAEVPEINDPVYDRNEKKIGVVKRIFGPVGNPYASVKPETAISNKMRGTDVYYKERKNYGKDKGRSRRD